jgi:hypothetical protein
MQLGSNGDVRNWLTSKDAPHCSAYCTTVIWSEACGRQRKSSSPPLLRSVAAMQSQMVLYGSEWLPLNNALKTAGQPAATAAVVEPIRRMVPLWLRSQTGAYIAISGFCTHVCRAAAELAIALET